MKNKKEPIVSNPAPRFSFEEYYKPKRIRKSPKILDGHDEVEKILREIQNSPMYSRNKQGEFLKWRDATAIRLMYLCGLRPAECLKLRWNDLDFEKNLIYVKPYYNKERNDLPAQMVREAKELLTDYRKIFEDFGVDTYCIFPNVYSGIPITTESFAKRFKTLLQAAGLLKVEGYNENGFPQYNYKLYSLRHSFCTQVFKTAGTSEAVTQLARHKRPESAHVYIHLNNEEKNRIAEAAMRDERKSIPEILKPSKKKEKVINNNFTINHNYDIKLIVEKQQAQIDQLTQLVSKLVENKNRVSEEEDLKGFAPRHLTNNIKIRGYKNVAKTRNL